MKISLVLLPELKRLVPSLAFAYLTSHLEKAGHTVSRHELNLQFDNPKWIKLMNQFNTDDSITKEILSGTHMPNPRINEYIRFCVNTVMKTKPEVVGFSVFWRNLNICSLVAKELKNLGIKIIFGGPETSINPDLTKYAGDIADYVVLGEAEKTLPVLLDNLDKADVPGIIYRKNGKIVNTGTWIPGDINDMEFPVFENIDIKNSILPWILPIAASRGCVNKCDFCVHPSLWQIFRQRTPRNVVDEIKFQIKSHDIRSFMFNDSLLNENSAFLEDFCRLVIKEGLDIQWFGNARADENLNGPLFKLMYKAGCRCLFFGLESGSDKILNDMNKGITTELIKKNIRDAHLNKIWVKVNLITGYPTETECDFAKSIEFILKNKDYIDSFMVRQLGIPKTTDLYVEKKIHTVDWKTAEKRYKLMESIFQHQDDFPYQIFFENADIDYKKTAKKEFNSKIGVDKEKLKLVMP